jgi:hypothetical protein
MVMNVGASRAPASAEPFNERLREISMFFEGSGRVHQTMRRVAAHLDAAGISYAIVGGMAVNAHRHERTTKDVDFLLTAAGFAAFRQLIGSDFTTVPGRPRRFVDAASGVTFDILITGQFPGNGQPGPISFPDPSTVTQNVGNLRVVDLLNLMQLKLAAGRYQDFADVVNLIRANALDESFEQRLAPSVRADYVECLEEMRREDEYEARQDQNFRDAQGGPHVP